jgi:hypothetical protein
MLPQVVVEGLLVLQQQGNHHDGELPLDLGTSGNLTTLILAATASPDGFGRKSSPVRLSGSLIIRTTISL